MFPSRAGTPLPLTPSLSVHPAEPPISTRWSCAQPAVAARATSAVITAVLFITLVPPWARPHRLSRPVPLRRLRLQVVQQVALESQLQGRILVAHSLRHPVGGLEALHGVDTRRV